MNIIGYDSNITNAIKNIELPMLYAGIERKERKERAEELLELVVIL